MHDDHNCHMHKHHVHPEHNRFAPECDDQLPAFSTMGRGPRGDSYRVKLVDPDTHEVTQLVGESYDEVTKTWNTEWMSENINGGFLEYQYHLRPYNVPSTFTITFKYHRPSAHGYIKDETGAKDPTSRQHDTYGAFCGDGQPNSSDYENNVGDDPHNECSWVWTTPAIPYVWNDQSPDNIVGSGVGTLFAREHHGLDGQEIVGWPYDIVDGKRIYKHERLVYPKGWTREHFNAPLPGQAWTSQLIFGYKGNIQIPDFWDLSMIVGAPIKSLTNILDGQKDQLTAGVETGDNILDLIKNWADHIHEDMGFGNDLIGDDGTSKVPTNPYAPNSSGKPFTIKNYVDYWIEYTQGWALDHMPIVRSGDSNVIVGTGKDGNHTVYTISLGDDVATKGDIPAAPKIIAGQGIKVTKSGNDYTVSANLTPGPGISIKPGKNNSIEIGNVMAGDFVELVEGRDFDYGYFNGWYAVNGNGSVGDPVMGPEIYVNLSVDPNDQSVSGGSIQFDWYNKRRLVHPEIANKGAGSNDPAANEKYVYIAHNTKMDSSNANITHAAICGWSFKESDTFDYSKLNDMSITTNSTTCLWGFTTADQTDSTSWPVFCEIRKTSDTGKSKYGGWDFICYVTMIGDGKNQQLDQTCKTWLNNNPCVITGRANTRVAGQFGNKKNDTSNV